MRNRESPIVCIVQKEGVAVLIPCKDGKYTQTIVTYDGRFSQKTGLSPEGYLTKVFECTRNLLEKGIEPGSARVYIGKKRVPHNQIKKYISSL